MCRAILATILATAAFAQEPVAVADLAAPAWKTNADLLLHNSLSREPLPGALHSGRTLADRNRISWQGLDIIVGEGLENVEGFTLEAVTKLYQQRACLADAIVVGRVNAKASHLATS